MPQLTHWGRDKISAIFPTTISTIFYCMKMNKFRLRFHWNLLPGVQLTIFQHWFRKWHGAGQATSHYLNQWWLVNWSVYASLGLSELMRWLFETDSKYKLPRKWSLHKVFNVLSVLNKDVCWEWWVVFDNHNLRHEILCTCHTFYFNFCLSSIFLNQVLCASMFNRRSPHNLRLNIKWLPCQSPRHGIRSS